MGATGLTCAFEGKAWHPAGKSQARVLDHWLGWGWNGAVDFEAERVLHPHLGEPLPHPHTKRKIQHPYPPQKPAWVYQSTREPAASHGCCLTQAVEHLSLRDCVPSTCRPASVHTGTQEELIGYLCFSEREPRPSKLNGLAAFTQPGQNQFVDLQTSFELPFHMICQAKEFSSGKSLLSPKHFQCTRNACSSSRPYAQESWTCLLAGCHSSLLSFVDPWESPLVGRLYSTMIQISSECKIFKCYPVVFPVILFLLYNEGHGNKLQKVFAQSLIYWQYPKPELLTQIEGFSSLLLVTKAICFKLRGR